MDLVKWWTCHGASGIYWRSIATHILSQVKSSSSTQYNCSTYSFIHSVKHNRMRLQKGEDLAYLHSNICVVFRRGEEYTIGHHIDWDVNVECQVVVQVQVEVLVEFPLLPNRHLVISLLMGMRISISNDMFM